MSRDAFEILYHMDVFRHGGWKRFGTYRNTDYNAALTMGRRAVRPGEQVRVGSVTLQNSGKQTDGGRALRRLVR